jgi:hypothetical protein
MSHEDRVADLSFTPAEVSAMTDTELQEARPAGIGLLVLYPIDKASTPRFVPEKPNEAVRTELDAVDDVMGVGLVFPTATVSDSAVSYKAVVLPLGDVEEFDEIDDSDSVDVESMDTESSLNGIEA